MKENLALNNLESRLFHRVILDILSHLIFTSALGFWVYSNTSNLTFALYFFAGGILLDLDHFIDYFIYFKAKFRLLDFLNCRYLKSRKTYLFFHSWELVLISLALSIFWGSAGLFLFSSGLVFHLVIDNVQRKNLLFYLLSYRFYKRFDASSILPEHKGLFY